MTYEKLIGLVSDLGLDGLDTTVYWFPDTSDAFLAKLRATAYKNAVSLYSIAARIRLCQPTPELRQAEVETIQKWVDVAQKVGAAHIRVFGGTVPKGVSEFQAISWAAESPQAWSRLLRSPRHLPRCRKTMAASAPMLSLPSRSSARPPIPSPVVNIDVGNFPKNGYQQVEYCLPYAVNCHFKVNVTGPNGEKLTADWDRLVGMFASSGYKGYLSLEYEESGAAETGRPALRHQAPRHRPQDRRLSLGGLIQQPDFFLCQLTPRADLERINLDRPDWPPAPASRPCSQSPRAFRRTCRFRPSEMVISRNVWFPESRNRVTTAGLVGPSFSSTPCRNCSNCSSVSLVDVFTRYVFGTL